MMVRSSSQIVLLLLWFLCGAIFGLSLSRGNSHMLCNRKDRDILLQFKKGVVDPSSLLSSWSNREDCCQWIGVRCDDVTGRVSKLNLNYDFICHQNYSSEQLTGEINLCVLQLDFLNYLDLSSNNFTVIHDSKNDKQRYYNSSFLAPHHQNANISSLHYLDLSWNFNLKIDNGRWLSHIPSLKYLNLSGIDLYRETNWLHSIPTQLPSLLELRLEACDLDSVSKPPTYVNFTSLVVLDLSSNNFNSKVFEWLFNIGDSLSYLGLDGNDIDGITDTLLNLQNLKHLSLNWNNLYGTIPQWLGQYKNLQELYLSGNSFHGSIPLDLGNLSSLILLDVSNNNLNGSLPESLLKLSSLESLIVAGNSLGGVLSESNFVNLTNLKVLDLTSSTFLFNVSSYWIPPFQLTDLRLESCILGPQFPTWIYTHRFLEHLDISNTGITSVDHDKFWSFVSNIYSLDISNNLISGDISNLVLNTEVIYLTSNKLYGGLPRITPNVSGFFARNNSFSGSISTWLCDIENTLQNNLLFLDLSDNLLSGELPDCWVNWNYLATIHLRSNNLTGRIPPSIGALSSLVGLDLYDNNLCGDIPLALQNFKELKFLILGRNHFSGSIPSWLPQSIVAMKLRGNEFSGIIPPQICQLSSLILLDLADNNLSGSIPRCLNNLTAMKDGREFFIPVLSDSSSPFVVWFHTKGQELEYKLKFETFWRLVDLSKNNLVGSIPLELFHLVGLTSLNLSQNCLTGKILPKIGQMKNLESLDLSMNQLFGEIPQVMSNLSFLEYLNLSFNNFVGKIPIGTQLQSFDASCYMGNHELCGAPLKNCTQEKKLVDLVKGKDEDEFLTWFYIGIEVGFAMGFGGVCVALFFKRAWRHAYFRFLYYINDQVYVKAHLVMNSILS